jgi:hypothetical protein
VRLALVFLLLAVTAEAQDLGQPGILFNPPGGGGSLTPGVTAINCPDGVYYSNAAGIFQCDVTKFGYFDAGAGNAVFTLRKTMSGASATNNFLNITGTFTASTSAANTAALYNLTTAGSSAFRQTGILVSMSSGYTGSSSTQAISTANSAAGTGTSNPNTGVSGQYLGTGAVGIGGYMAQDSVVTNRYYRDGSDARSTASGHGRFGRWQ